VTRRLRRQWRRLTDAGAELHAYAAPVRALLAIEAVIAAVATHAALTWVWRTATSFDPAPAGPPPWPALLAAPVLGAAGHLLRRFRPLAAARRWHGVALRRLDERWSKT
jgi:hypothetical protein